jgi:hypothetical protein
MADPDHLADRLKGLHQAATEDQALLLAPLPFPLQRHYSGQILASRGRLWVAVGCAIADTAAPHSDQLVLVIWTV